MKLPLNFQRHAGQQECLYGLLNHDPDIAVIVASRGFGKSLWVTCDIVIPQMFTQSGYQVMWVAPTYKICKAPVDDVWNGTDEITGERYVQQFDTETGFKFWEFKSGDMEIHAANESKLFMRSADNPDSIVAKGYNLIVVDEAALISKTVFMQHILPTGRKAGCKFILITTPRGKNWVYEMYLAGQDRSKPRYWSIKMPWWKRPNYPKVLVELMKDMPSHIRQQEFEAEFIADSSGVFKNLQNVFTGMEIQFPSPDQEWVGTYTDEEYDSETRILAADLAKHNDYTVIVVMGMESKKIIYYQRFNKRDYKVTLEIIKRVAEQYDADVIYDATGVGSGVGDFLSADLNAYPFVFTNSSKAEIINKLAIACEFSEIKIPNIVTIREEFELFTYTISRTRAIIYNAPDGKHDDCVAAIAMAVWYSQENSGKGVVQEVDSFINAVEQIYTNKTPLQKMMEDDD